MRESVVIQGVARLTGQQQAEVARLAQIDRRVRAHEQAHLAAAGAAAQEAEKAQRGRVLDVVG